MLNYASSQFVLLCCFVSSLFLLPPLCSAVGAEESWEGKTIIVKKPDIRIGHNNEDSERVVTATLTLSSYSVLADKGGLLKVRQNDIEDWFDKTDAVLLENAVDFFTARIRANPKDADSYVMRAEAWRLQGDWDKLIKDLDEAIQIDPKDAAAFTNRGRGWSNRQDYDHSIKDFDEAIRLNPKYADAYESRAHAWAAKKDYDRAINDYDEAIRLEPRNAFVFRSRALAWAGKKDYDRAIKDYDEAIRLAPMYLDAFFKRGNAWRDKQDYDRAIKDYDECIRLAPKFVDAFNNRASAWSARKDYGRAINDFEEAFRLDPKDRVSCANAAWLKATCVNVKYRDGKRAVELAVKACELSEWKDAADFDTLAATYAEAGDFEKAVKWQEKALADKEFEKRLGDEARARLRLYKDNKPFRD
jgi:tetratricopeptide (TPR) repeat protein